MEGQSIHGGWNYAWPLKVVSWFPTWHLGEAARGRALCFIGLEEEAMTTKSLPAVTAFNPHNDAPNDMSQMLTRQEIKGLPHFLTQDAITAAIRLNKLVQEDPEHLLERSGLLIDTDPRHVGRTPIQSLELPGVSLQQNVARPSSVAAGSRLSSRLKDNKAKEVESNAPVSFSSYEQNLMEEASAREKLLYEMKQNLYKLKEYGKMIGISFDVKLSDVFFFLMFWQGLEKEESAWKNSRGKVDGRRAADLEGSGVKISLRFRPFS
eukprot:767461-Hanusia_phi.AAC.8